MTFVAPPGRAGPRAGAHGPPISSGRSSRALNFCRALRTRARILLTPIRKVVDNAQAGPHTPLLLIQSSRSGSVAPMSSEVRILRTLGGPAALGSQNGTMLAVAPRMRWRWRDRGGRFLDVVGDAPKKAGWDERFIEHLAWESWAAANDPAGRRRRPSFWAQIKSPYYWFAVLAFGVAAVLWIAAGPGWPHALAAILYVVSLLATALSRRDARAAGLRRSTTDDR